MQKITHDCEKMVTLQKPFGILKKKKKIGILILDQFYKK